MHRLKSMSAEEITDRIHKHMEKVDADIERKKYELHLQDALAKKEQELRDRIAKAVCYDTPVRYVFVCMCGRAWARLCACMFVCMISDSLWFFFLAELERKKRDWEIKLKHLELDDEDEEK